MIAKCKCGKIENRQPFRLSTVVEFTCAKCAKENKASGLVFVDNGEKEWSKGNRK